MFSLVSVQIGAYDLSYRSYAVLHLPIAFASSSAKTVTCTEAETLVRPVRSYAQTDLDMPPEQQKRDQCTMIIGNSG
jgi:hypothetical protein